MIPHWPEQLPLPLREDWSRQRVDVRRQRQSDAAIMGYGRKTSAVATQITASLLLNRFQLSVFDQFWDICGQGVKIFTMYDPTAHDWNLLSESGSEILITDGTELMVARKLYCMWGEETPSESISGIMFKKTFGIVVLP